MHLIGGYVTHGGDFDHWDLAAHAGLFGTVRVRMTIEEHGSGRQLVRFAARPVWLRLGGLVCAVFAALALGAVAGGAWVAGGLLVCALGLLGFRGVYERGVASGAVCSAIDQILPPPDGVPAPTSADP